MSQKDGNITIYFGLGPSWKRIRSTLNAYKKRSGRTLSLSKLIQYLVKQSLWKKSEDELVSDIIEAEG